MHNKNRGYWTRVEAFDEIILSFLQLNLSNDNSVKKQIISLGAGIDTTFWRLCEKYESIMESNLHKYIEMDFLETTVRKIHLMSHDSASKKLFLENKFLNIKNSKHNVIISKKEGFVDSKYYTLIAGDMCYWDKIETVLTKTVKNFSFNRPTLFLSECVLIYMPVGKSKYIIEWIEKKFTNGVALALYEQILPNDAFGKQMIKNLGLFCFVLF